jgi:hypothetical protein
MSHESLSYIITSSNPHCILGYYGPYKDGEEALRYFESMRPRDPSAVLRLTSRLDMDAIIHSPRVAPPPRPSVGRLLNRENTAWYLAIRQHWAKEATTRLATCLGCARPTTLKLIDHKPDGDTRWWCPLCDCVVEYS